MSKGKRSLAAVLLAFVAYRISVEFIEFTVAIVLGLAVGVATWLLTASREKAEK